MKIVYTVSLALIALLSASTTTSAQEITAVDLDTTVDAPAEVGAEGDFALGGAAEVDYDAEFVGAEATEGAEGDVVAADSTTTDVAEADREAVTTDAETTEVGADAETENNATGTEADTTEVGAEAEADTTEVATAAPVSEVGADSDLDLTVPHSFVFPEVRQDVIMTVNKKRQEAGLPQVCLNYKLMNTAQSQANYLASTNTMTVTGKGGSSPSDRGRAAGYNSTGVAELVGAGYANANDLINAWFQSADSKAILLGNYTHIGPGYTVDEKQQYKYYWTVDFSYGFGEECSGLAA